MTTPSNPATTALSHRPWVPEACEAYVQARAGETVAGVRAADLWARSFLNNGAAPSGVIESERPLTEAHTLDLKTQLANKFVGAVNAGRPLVLEGGMSWKAISLSPEDSELLETRKFGVVEICRLFQVPPPIIQAYENNTFTNAAQAGLWFATFCLAPWARRIAPPTMPTSKSGRDGMMMRRYMTARSCVASLAPSNATRAGRFIQTTAAKMDPNSSP